MTIYAGIDPGKTGAIVLIEDGRIKAVIDFKDVSMVAQGAILIPCFDIEELRSHGPVIALREDVSGRGGQYTATNQSPDRIFSFGVYTGILSYAIQAAGWQVSTINPTSWKSKLKLIGKSDAAIYKFSETLFSDRSSFPKRHDITDALLLAYMASRMQVA